MIIHEKGKCGLMIGDLFDIIINFTEFLWGTPLLFLITLTGCYFCFKTSFLPFREIPSLLKKNCFIKTHEGEMSQFQCLTTAMAGTIGSGNIAGVATAIAVGGPGAVFWIWIISFVCMILKMVEVTMAVAYRVRDDNGNFWGGPMFYINKGILGKKGKLLAKCYAIALISLVVTDACFIQPNTFANAFYEVFNIPMIYSGIIWIILSILIINLGKAERIGVFCSFFVPLMCILYLVGTITIIVCNIGNIMPVLKMIVKYAFQPLPAIGGFSGASVKTIISKGVSRGIFSNEAGQGTSTTIYAKSTTGHPVKAGIYSMLEVAADSLVCILTALSILITFSWTSGANGISLTLNAFSNVWGIYGEYIVCTAIALFTFSSYLSFFIEFNTCLKYLFVAKKSTLIHWLYFAPPFISVLMPSEIVWTLADAAVGFIVIPNIVALIMLHKNFLNLWEDYRFCK